jgi:hypothetical protein
MVTFPSLMRTQPGAQPLVAAGRSPHPGQHIAGGQAAMEVDR